jgi:chromosome partitioning protein
MDVERRMRSLAFWHQKGGTGKTTLAIASACRLASIGRRVLLLDTDPQGTAAAWGDRFADSSGLAVRTHIGERIDRLLERLAGGFDDCIIDCPPTLASATLALPGIVDRLVIPTRPALPDIWALDAVAVVLQDACARGLHPQPVVVFNQHRGEDLQPLRDRLDDLGLAAAETVIAESDGLRAIFAGAVPPPGIADLLGELETARPALGGSAAGILR